MEKLNEKNGITLIALVITIIVLLILAGVSIAMLTGENGILTQAQNAKNQTEEAEIKERIKLAVNAARISDNGYEELGQNNLQEEMDKEFGEGETVIRDNGDESFTISLKDDKKDYTVLSNGEIEDGIDWKDAMAKAKAPEEQETTSKNVIGIGTNGQAVNMDLWLYTFGSVTNGDGLNSKEVFQNTEYNTNGTNSETIRTAGYKGTETDGKDIIIPQYISEEGGKTYNPVTSLYRTFNSNTNITTMPLIPTTVISMISTFENCKNLKGECIIPNSVQNINWCFNASGIEKIKEIPNSVVSMVGSFSFCNSLEYVNLKIPDKVKSLSGTFRNCINLKEANLILPEGLESMSLTLYYCTSLTKGPDVIPESVTDMGQTFEGDAKLTGEMTIKASPTTYGNIFRQAATDENARLVIKAGNNNGEFLRNMIETDGMYNGEHIVVE
mgnify:CR=1 FL=1